VDVRNDPESGADKNNGNIVGVEVPPFELDNTGNGLVFIINI
jgi:hypothetical protein